MCFEENLPFLPSFYEKQVLTRVIDQSESDWKDWLKKGI